MLSEVGGRAVPVHVWNNTYVPFEYGLEVENVGGEAHCVFSRRPRHTGEWEVVMVLPEDAARFFIRQLLGDVTLC